MARVAWLFTDTVVPATYSWPVNPNDGASPSYRKKISHQSTLAPDSAALVYEGQGDPVQFSFSGTILTEEQYSAFVTWWKKRYPVRITDDLGRTFDVVFVDFEPKRVRSSTYPYRHTYQANCLVLDMTDLDEL